MSDDMNGPPDPVPKTLEQLLAEMLRENERLRRQIEDTQRERDQYKGLFLSQLARTVETDLTAEDIANAVPAEPFLEDLIRRLEKK